VEEGARLAELVASGVQAFVIAYHDDGAQDRGLVDTRDIECHADGATRAPFRRQSPGTQCAPPAVLISAAQRVARQGEEGGVPDDCLILEAAGKSETCLSGVRWCEQAEMNAVKLARKRIG